MVRVHHQREAPRARASGGAWRRALTFELPEIARCPGCGSALAWDGADASCRSCARSYVSLDSIPQLVVADDADGGQKQLQARHFDHDVDTEWEIERPVRAPALYAWLLQ